MAIRMSVLCQTVALSGGKSFRGNTIDVSKGGMLVEINGGRLDEGQLLCVEMDVPAESGLMEGSCRYSGYARVCRTGIEPSQDANNNAHAVALEFCDRFPFRT